MSPSAIAYAWQCILLGASCLPQAHSSCQAEHDPHAPHASPHVLAVARRAVDDAHALQRHGARGRAHGSAAQQEVIVLTEGWEDGFIKQPKPARAAPGVGGLARAQTQSTAVLGERRCCQASRRTLEQSALQRLGSCFSGRCAQPSIPHKPTHQPIQEGAAEHQDVVLSQLCCIRRQVGVTHQPHVSRASSCERCKLGRHGGQGAGRPGGVARAVDAPGLIRQRL